MAIGMYLLIILLVFLAALTSISAQQAGCDFVQNAQIGQTYYIYSPNYPDSYSPGTQCRWRAVCPLGYNCRLDCYEINLPSTPGCSGDRLLISKTGDDNLVGADAYCGQQAGSVVSTGQRISIGLIATQDSQGGRFYCRLTSQIINPLPSQCSCGLRKTNRIVGGVETGVNEYPMMAGVVDRSLEQIKCGATIINNQYVLTAAHCVRNRTSTNTLILVGEHNVNTGTDTTATRGYLIDRIIPHPSYNPNTYDYDIALIRVVGVIEFGPSVGPVCLPFKYKDSDLTGRMVTMLGWGTQFPGGPTSNVLMKVDVQMISQTSCQNAVSTYVSKNQLCTYTQGKDACQDDSGGPALYTDPNTGLLFSVGIISHGSFCASGKPGINTRVTEMLQWIVDTTQANFCIKP